MDLTAAIKKLAREKNALILAHNYQRDEIQDIADHTGDSLELSQIAAKNDAELIVFCGVHFMAESASLLSPDKKVIIPDPEAGCPMAEMVEPEDVLELKKGHPGAKVVTYINSSAAVKALSDIICTSSNALKIVERIDADEIIFLPDKNLAGYVQRFTRKTIITGKGFCPTHERFSRADLIFIKQKHPDALVMVHPECRPEVADMADMVLSTGRMVKFVAQTDVKKIIVGTETGIIHKLKLTAPGIEFIPASDSFICPNMKKINLNTLYRSLVNGEFVVTVDESIREKARRALERMLELSY
ncbi:MAG: quinolinate synthase [Spirochaetes bacterium RBG_16_49_21]|nr:MAG: quinolinate synthase [Spirochaetes bacterium RBG_16_49_21]